MPDVLAGNSCLELLPETIAGIRLPEVTAGNCCRKFLQGVVADNSYRGLLPQVWTGNCCRELLPEVRAFVFAGNDCRALLPHSLEEGKTTPNEEILEKENNE